VERRQTNKHYTDTDSVRHRNSGGLDSDYLAPGTTFNEDGVIHSNRAKERDMIYDGRVMIVLIRSK
jgi:hypothetical protein